MKKIFFILLATIALISATPSKSAMDFGITGGFSTPNDNINDVWNSDRLQDTGKKWHNLYRDATEIGYNLGIRMRFPLSKHFTFVGGISYNRFPKTDLDLRLVGSDSIITDLNSTQSLVPITLGMNIYLIRSVIGLYGSADLSYNYILNSVEYKGLPINASLSPSDSRVGFSLGAGMDIDLKVVLANLEVKYHMLNLIGKTDEEKSKAFLTVNLGIYFGNSKKATTDSDEE